MDSHHHHHQHRHLHHLQYLQQHHQTQSMAVDAASAAAATSVGDRFPQWSVQETKELIEIRAELDQTFMETKRNKLLWEVISNKMRDKGFLRSPEQCKCKWKNLVTRYKGCETMEAEVAKQQFPFYDDMQMIFTSRMQRMLWAENEGGSSGTVTTTKKKMMSDQFSSDDEEDEVNANEEMVSAEGAFIEEGGKHPRTLNPKKNILKRRKGNGNSNGNEMRQVLEEFMRQQMIMEREWRETWEAREKERAEREEEWRTKMEQLERERMTMERVWREREEQRRAKEESRAQKRDALINALLSKLTRDG